MTWLLRLAAAVAAAAEREAPTRPVRWRLPSYNGFTSGWSTDERLPAQRDDCAPCNGARANMATAKSLVGVAQSHGAYGPV